MIISQNIACTIASVLHGIKHYISPSPWPLVCLQIGFKNMEGVQHVPLTQEKATRLVKDVFISAAERDVYTGDALRLCIVTKEGIKEETFSLRKD